MFDTDLLKSFVAVAENGGFTKAAKVLNSTQSTISAQIQRLESDAERPLFVRSTRSVRLTSAGEMLLGYAQTILRLNEDARLRLSGARHAGRLRVGAGEDLADSWLPGVLRRSVVNILILLSNSKSVSEQACSKRLKHGNSISS